MGQHRLAEQVDKYVKLMRGYFRTQVLHEGHALYSEETVYAGVLSAAGDIYEATVDDDGDLHLVDLNLAFLPHSRCDCGVRGSCRHMAAAMLQCMVDAGVPAEVFMSKVFAGVAQLGGPLSVNVLTSKSKKDPVAPFADYLDWHRAFPGMVRDRYITHAAVAVQVIEELTKPTERWGDRQHAELYKLHAILYTLQLSLTSSSYSYSGYRGTNAIVGTLLQLFIDTSQSLDPARLENREDDRRYILGLAERARTYGFEMSGYVAEWLYLYRFIWSGGLRLGAKEGREEQQRLLEAVDAGEVGWELQHDATVIAAVHHEVMAQRDEEAFRLLESKLRLRLRPGYFYNYLFSFQQTEDWPRLRRWLQFLAPYVPGAPATPLAIFFEVWRKLAEQSGRQEDGADYREQLVAMLPYTMRLYEEDLLERGEWKGWVDLQLMLGESARREELKHVQAQAPEVLLPYYHQWTLRWIESKQRAGYKEAVRQMKKLQTIYRKLKREPEFRRFVSMVETRFSRLRALQEEMRKGKLIG